MYIMCYVLYGVLHEKLRIYNVLYDIMIMMYYMRSL